MKKKEAEIKIGYQCVLYNSFLITNFTPWGEYIQVEVPLESTRMPCRATRRTPRLSSGTWWPCTRPSRTRRSERSTIACSLRYRIFLMKFLDYCSFRLLTYINSFNWLSTCIIVTHVGPARLEDARLLLPPHEEDRAGREPRLPLRHRHRVPVYHQQGRLLGEAVLAQRASGLPGRCSSSIKCLSFLLSVGMSPSHTVLRRFSHSLYNCAYIMDFLLVELGVVGGIFHIASYVDFVI